MPQEVWSFLAVQKKWFSVRELSEILTMPEDTVRTQLKKLINAKKIRRLSDGRVYRYRGQPGHERTL